MAKSEKQKEWYKQWRQSEEGKAKHKEYVANWKAKNRERYLLQCRNSNLKFSYGITLDDYNKMLEDQGGGCAICFAKPQTSRAFHVDHSHETGKIRGILCSNCNTGIGKLKESQELMERAVEYIKRKYS